MGTPGYSTAEFWLGVAAQVVTFVIDSGVLDLIPDHFDEVVAQWVNFVVMALNAMGYEVPQYVPVPGGEA